ncbi:MAG: protein translocase subunit SecF [Candidatus Zambryskibacteria bacterium CG_4_9_14_3_um_filter_42_9]|nr:MAG: protein translocase subunit SecF [Candidatus Zambryskibacteria bacterium CG_4_9_14_3_um_filter_42_9]
MSIIKYRKIFFIISGVMTIGSLFLLYFYGLNLGVDFRGGTITEVGYTTERPSKEGIERAVTSLGFGSFSVRPSGESNYIIRTHELSHEESSMLVSVLPQDGENMPSLERSNTVGPIAGSQLEKKALIAVSVVVIMIVLFVAFAFRKISEPVSSWKYALATIISLAHDVFIPTGIFVLLGIFYGLEIDLLFVTGLLAILGYSVNDTIVVFDRVRENLSFNHERQTNEPFENVVGRSVTETLARSINTSLTILLVLAVLYWLGSGVTQDFVLLLMIGTVVGTYSSIFLASPLLVTFYKLSASGTKK